MPKRSRLALQFDPYLIVPLLLGAFLCAPLLARGVPNTADGPAVGGLYPASDWAPGEIVADTRSLPLSAGRTEASVLVGLYDLASGEQQAVRVEGLEEAQSDAVRIALHAGR